MFIGSSTFRFASSVQGGEGFKKIHPNYIKYSLISLIAMGAISLMVLGSIGASGAGLNALGNTGAFSMIGVGGAALLTTGIFFVAVKLLRKGGSIRQEKVTTEEVAQNVKEKFFESVDNNKISQCEKLLAEIENLDEPGGQEYGEWTVLQLAISKGNFEMVKWLLDKGANIEARPHNSEPPLYLAVKKNHTKIVLELLERKADSGVLYYNESCFERALKRNCNLILMQALVEKADQATVSQMLHRKEEDELPLLYHAIKASENKDSFVELLLKHGARVDVEYGIGYVDNQTLFHTAAEVETGEHILQMLLEKDASFVDAKTECGETPLCLAIKNGRSESVRCLLEHGADARLLYQDDSYFSLALEHANPEVLEILVEGVDQKIVREMLNRKHARITPLFRALWAPREKERLVKLCLDHGARVNETGIDQKTPLHFAAESEDGVPIMKMLLEKDSLLLEAETNRRMTPLCCAVFHNRIDSVRWLIEQGAKKESVTNNFYIREMRREDKLSEEMLKLFDFSDIIFE